MNDTTQNDASYSHGHIDSEKNSLAARVKECMSDKSVSAFARECGMNESTLRYILSGSFPRTDHLTAIANASGVTVDWLATGKGIKYIRDLKHAQERLNGAPPRAYGELPYALKPYEKRLDALLHYLAMIDDEAEVELILSEVTLRAETVIKLNDLQQTVNELRAEYLKKNTNHK